MKLIDKTTETDKEIRNFTASDEYVSLIYSIMYALEALPMDPISVGMASAMINRLQRLCFSSEKFDLLTHIPATYMDILRKNGLVDDVIKFGQDFVAAWEEKYIYSTSDNTAYSYLICLMKLITVLKEHGRINEALNYGRNTTMVAPSQQHKYYLIRNLQCNLTTTHIELLCEAGLDEEALKFAQELSVTDSDNPPLGAHNDCMLNQLFHLAVITETSQLLPAEMN